MAYITKKEKEGHLKTKTTKFGKKKKIEYIKKKQKDEIVDTVKKATGWITKKNYSNK